MCSLTNTKRDARIVDDGTTLTQPIIAHHRIPRFVLLSAFAMIPAFCVWHKQNMLIAPVYEESQKYVADNRRHKPVYATVM